MRWAARRSGARSPWSAPACRLPSASISACASVRTPSRRKSTSAPPALRDRARYRTGGCYHPVARPLHHFQGLYSAGPPRASARRHRPAPAVGGRRPLSGAAPGRACRTLWVGWQLSGLCAVGVGAGGGTRTPNLLVTRQRPVVHRVPAAWHPCSSGRVCRRPASVLLSGSSGAWWNDHRNDRPDRPVRRWTRVRAA